MVEFVSENTAELLGAVIAHEIGHALLPGHPHSKAGIMRPEWEAREAHASLRGQMNFSARESCAMRNELNRRAVIESNFPTRSGDTSPTAQTFGLVP